MRVLKIKPTKKTTKSTTSTTNTNPTTNTSTSTNTNSSTNYDARIKALETRLNAIKECDCDKSILTNIQSRLTTLEQHEFSVNDINDINALIQKLTDYGYFKYDENAGGKQVKVINAPHKDTFDLIDEYVTIGTPYYDANEAKKHIYFISSFGNIFLSDLDAANNLDNNYSFAKSVFRVEQHKITIYFPFLGNSDAGQMMFSQPLIVRENTFSKSIWYKDYPNDGDVLEQPIEFTKHTYTETINNVNFKIDIDSKIYPFYTLTFPDNIINIPYNKFVSHEENSNIVKVYTKVDDTDIDINDFDERKFIIECDSSTTHYVIKFTV